MAKQRRPPARRAASKPTSRRKRPATKLAVARKSSAGRKRTAAPVVKIREAYARAIKLYEKGLKALQRRNFQTAKTAFQQLLDQYPEEKELHDRAKLYLNVCAREAGPKAKPPKTTAERLLAATVALNRHDVDEALSLLRKAAKTYPDDDHVHYMLAVTHALREDAEAAATHLNKAIELNPDNQLQAKQEPDFDRIRESKPFLEAIATS